VRQAPPQLQNVLNTKLKPQKHSKRPLLRRRHVKVMKRVGYLVVLTVVNLSLFMTQTRITLAIDQAMNQPAKVTLSAGILARAGHSVGEWLSTMGALFSSGTCTTPTGTDFGPAGMPYPWQAAVPAGPFSVINTSSGNMLTTVPVVSVEGLGRDVNFAFYHNSMSQAGGLATMPHGWRHSYSRSLTVDTSPLAVNALTTDDGRVIKFSPDGPNQWKSITGTYLTVTYDSAAPTGQKFTLLYKNQEKDFFNIDGRLTRLEDASGNYLSVNYGSNIWCKSNSWPRISTVTRNGCMTDPCNEVLKFNYGTCTSSCGNDPTRDGCLAEVIAPAIGREGAEQGRKYYINCTAGEVMISTARTDTMGNPIFNARFVQFAGRITGVIDRLGTLTGYLYTTSNQPTVMLEDWFGPNLRSTTYDWTTYPHNSGVGAHPVICNYTVKGYRSNPSTPNTIYCYSTAGCLEEVIDPLSRTVVDQTWNANYTLASSTNVFGGTTSFTYDANGNILTTTEPNSAVTTFTYDSLNNIESITDPLSNATYFNYGDANNPTKPTQVDVGGAGWVAMGWGQNAHDLGQIKSAQNSNGVLQEWYYGDGSETTKSCGQLYAKTFGYSSNIEPIAEYLTSVDCSGNSNMSNRGNGANSSIGDENEEFDDTLHEIDAEKPVYSCATDYDADGNPVSTCDFDCSDGPTGVPPGSGPQGGSQPDMPSNQFNGNNQPTRLRGYSDSGGGAGATPLARNQYEFTYDVFGRNTATKTDTESYAFPTWAQNNACSGDHTFESEMYADLNSDVERIYDDVNGTYTWGYGWSTTGCGSPSMMEPQAYGRQYETDLAGRTTKIKDMSGGTLVEYTYTDSTITPAVTEHKYAPGGVEIISEYYVDSSGQTSKVVHIVNDGVNPAMEKLAFEYTRDLKHRITRVTEYTDGTFNALTTYEYGSGNLVASELDSGTTPEADKYYYSWFAGMQSLTASDPNRLVKEVRTGANAYHHEYRYDAGGNRLAKIESTDISTSGGPNYQPHAITRYNYARPVNLTAFNDNTVFHFDPRTRITTDIGAGHPVPPGATMSVGSTGEWRVRDINDYTLQGQDKLLSYFEMRIDPNTGLLDGDGAYGAYEYRRYAGSMSTIIAYDADSKELEETMFLRYEKNKVRSILKQYSYWGDASVPAPDNNLYVNIDQSFMQRHDEADTFAYDVFGRRMITAYCGGLANVTACKDSSSTFTYIDNHIIERRGAHPHGGVPSPYQSVSFSEAGLFGLYARTARNFVDPPPPTGPYVPGAPEFCKYFFLNDSMGNVRAMVDPSGNVQYQVYDAFGNEMGGGTLMKCNPTSQRMLAGGRAQWRGAEGSQTDINAAPIEAVTPPVYGADNWPTSHESYSRKTNGLVFMQNRFYEPATGRFTQADPVPIDLVSLSKAQNNRWAYCANDPVNFSDPTGATPTLAILAAIVAFIGAYFGWKGMGDAAFGCAIGSLLLAIAQAIVTYGVAKILKALLLLSGLALIIAAFVGLVLLVTNYVLIPMIHAYAMAQQAAMDELFGDAGNVSRLVHSIKRSRLRKLYFRDDPVEIVHFMAVIA